MYYHDIQFSFNWWFFVIVAFGVCSALVGYANVSKRDDKYATYVARRFNNKFFTVVAVLFAAVATLNIFVESNKGIEQFLLNSLNGIDDPALIYGVLPFVYAGIFMMAIGLYHTIMQKCQDGKYNRLSRVVGMRELKTLSKIYNPKTKKSEIKIRSYKIKRLKNGQVFKREDDDNQDCRRAK